MLKSLAFRRQVDARRATHPRVHAWFRGRLDPNTSARLAPLVERFGEEVFDALERTLADMMALAGDVGVEVGAADDVTGFLERVHEKTGALPHDEDFEAFEEVVESFYAQPIYPLLEHAMFLHPVGLERVRRVLGLLEGVGVARAVDVAVGPAVIFTELLRRRPELRGEAFDISAPCVAYARAMVRRAGLEGRAEVAAGDARRLPSEARRFDLAVATEVIEHVPDPAVLVAELARVLEPGGVLVASVPLRLPWGAHLSAFETREEAEALFADAFETEAFEVEPFGAGAALCFGRFRKST